MGDFGWLAAGYDIAWQCEIDEWCHKILDLRFPESKKYHDIKKLKGSELEKVDVIAGGFPCQPFSVAGKQRGAGDDRHLWPDMFRVIKECRPRWIVGENVPGIINMALDAVCADLEGEGYEVWPIVFSSHAVGAWHKRDRLWIVGHSKHDGSYEAKVRGSMYESSIKKEPDTRGEFNGAGSLSENVGDTECNGSSDGYQKSRGSVKGCKQGGMLESQGAGSYISDANGEPGRLSNKQREENPEIIRSGEDVPDDPSFGVQGLRAGGEQEPHAHGQEKLSLRENKRPWKSFWNSEPDVGRVANGVADRVHRLKMLGNGQVPACTYVIGQMIMEIENESKN